MKMKDIKSWTTEKISQRVFYAIIILSVVVFGLFFLIGYDMPFDENPDFNAPLFTDVLMVLMWLLLIVTIALSLVAIIRTYKISWKSDAVVNGVPQCKIFRFTWIGTLLLLIVTFLIGSSVPMLINGEEYGDWLWLKVSDMLVTTSICMLIIGIGVVLFGATRYIRKERKHEVLS